MTPHEPFMLHHPRPAMPMEPSLPLEASFPSFPLEGVGGEGMEGEGAVSMEELRRSGMRWLNAGMVLQCAVAFALTAAVVFTNLLVLVVRVRDRQLRKQVSSFFIKSLAVSDLCVGVFQAVPGVMGVLGGEASTPDDTEEEGATTSGYWWVKISVYGTSTAAAVSMYAVMGITIDRYIAVTHPLRYWAIVGDKKYAKLSVIGMWIGAGVIMLPVLTPLVPTRYSASAFAPVVRWARCVPCGAALGYLVYAPATLTLALVYGVIVRISARHVRSMEADRRRGTVGSVVPVPRESLGRRTKYLRNSLTIVITFLITHLPRGGYILYEMIAGISVPWADFVTLWLTLANNVSHALIYNWGHKDFRRALRETLHFCPGYGRKRTYEQLIYSVSVPAQAMV